MFSTPGWEGQQVQTAAPFGGCGLAPTGLAPTPMSTTWAGQAVVRVEVGNVMVLVDGLTPDLQQRLDMVTSYPLDQGLAQASGWQRPEALAGDRVWDGWRHLSRFPSPGKAVVPTGLMHLLVETCHAYGASLQIHDVRERPPDGVPDRGALPLRPYQHAAVEAALRAGRGVLDMPPRAGKTLTALELVRCISLPTVWIVPTRNIGVQTVRAADLWFGKHYAEHLTGSGWEEVRGAPIVVCTLATAKMLPAAFWMSRQVLVGDEIHHAASSTWHEVLSRCDHIYYRYGMTGTFFRSGHDDLALHAVLSNTVFKITTTELLALGYLVPVDVVFLPIPGPRAHGSGSQSYQRGVGLTGIFAHDYRNGIAAWAAVTLWSRRKKVLVLVATKQQGMLICEQIAQHVPKLPGARWQGVEFVSTDRPSTVCQQVIDSFTEGTGVQVLVGTSMVGEGTDLPSTDALVYAPGGKAEVSHTQAVFRVCTAVPGKSRAVVVDFADRHHRTLSEHALERLDTYVRQPTFRTQVLDPVEALPAWLDGLWRA